MTKLKQPLFSLDADGSIGDSLTYTHRQGVSVAEAKPQPIDRHTLSQYYQRWDYQEAVVLWHALSNATQQQWQSVASRFHMTGFAFWMKDRLSTKHGLVACWHLDEASGAHIVDASGNGLHGTYHGCVSVDGAIGPGRWFDGIDDYGFIPQNDLLDITQALTLECFVTVTSNVGWRSPCAKRANTYRFVFRAGSYFPSAYITVAGVARELPSLIAVVPGELTHLAMTYDVNDLANNFRIYVNGAIGRQATFGNPIDTNNLGFYIGATWPVGQPHIGLVDEVALWSRAHPHDEVIRRSLRRYP